MPLPSSSLLAPKAIGAATALSPFRKALQSVEAGIESHAARANLAPRQKSNATLQSTRLASTPNLRKLRKSHAKARRAQEQAVPNVNVFRRANLFDCLSSARCILYALLPSQCPFLSFPIPKHLHSLIPFFGFQRPSPLRLSLSQSRRSFSPCACNFARKCLLSDAIMHLPDARPE